MKLKHKKNSKVKMIANTSLHEFKIGDEVVIERLHKWDRSNYSYVARDSRGYTWFFSEAECEGIEE